MIELVREGDDLRALGARRACAPSGQPSAGAMFTVGMSDFSGGGSTGSGPVPLSTSSFAALPQLPSANAATTAINGL